MELSAAADEIENGIAKLSRQMIEEQKSPAKVATEVVKQWLSHEGYLKAFGTTITLVSGFEASGVDKKYLELPFWEGIFSESCNSPEYWRYLFKNCRYFDIRESIPDDRVLRMVFHFVHQWQDRLGTLLGDKHALFHIRVSVLKQQMENIVFLGRKLCKGSTWHMMSLPDKSLQQALADPGKTVPLLDKDGNLLRDIEGYQCFVRASPGISNSAGDGPKPDILDKLLFTKIREFVRTETSEEASNQWTMVRCRFVSQEKERRCYAFSGSNPKKQLHKMPEEFWKRYKDCFALLASQWEIFVVGLSDREGLGQRVILSLFEALKPAISRDLHRLTKLTAIENKEAVEALILNERSDLFTLDYGEYYDCVIKKLNAYDARIKTAVGEYLTKKSTCQEVEKLLSGHMWRSISVGGKNQNFQPNMEALKGHLQPYFSNADEATAIIGKIAGNLLKELETELEKFPSLYLVELGKRIRQAHCGEDNVLSKVLCEMLDHVEVFSDTQVDFVAMDGNNPDGKPFCKVCNRKVRFFSTLPWILRTLGLTGKDIYNQELSELFAEYGNP